MRRCSVARLLSVSGLVRLAFLLGFSGGRHRCRFLGLVDLLLARTILLLLSLQRLAVLGRRLGLVCRLRIVIGRSSDRGGRSSWGCVWRWRVARALRGR